MLDLTWFVSVEQRVIRYTLSLSYFFLLQLFRLNLVKISDESVKQVVCPITKHHFHLFGSVPSRPCRACVHVASCAIGKHSGNLYL